MFGSNIHSPFRSCLASTRSWRKYLAWDSFFISSESLAASVCWFDAEQILNTEFIRARLMLLETQTEPDWKCDIKFTNYYYYRANNTKPNCFSWLNKSRICTQDVVVCTFEVGLLPANKHREEQQQCCCHAHDVELLHLCRATQWRQELVWTILFFRQDCNSQHMLPTSVFQSGVHKKVREFFWKYKMWNYRLSSR